MDIEVYLREAYEILQRSKQNGKRRGLERYLYQLKGRAVQVVVLLLCAACPLV
jgi:hypothetical protein